MPRVKKDEAKEAAEQATQNFAAEVVAKLAVSPQLPPVPPERPCAIEDAPLNSKATVGMSGSNEKEARITTPLTGTSVLPADDLMWTLPVGAKVRKISNVQFIAVQMQDGVGHPPLVAVTARDVIAGFNDHFHPRGQ